jgi:hypothetical protein
MARIRSIKPEFWTNERVMECSMNARLLFIGMWNFADDLGRLALSARTIKAQILPSDDISSENILGMVGELLRNGLVLKYEVEGREYLQIVGWQHQRIDKPQPGKFPAPVNGYSKNDPGMVAPDRKGREGKGEDSNSEANASGAEAPLDPSEPERQLFSRGKEILGKSSGGQIAKLLKAAGGNVALARSKIELAATKDNAHEFIAKVITTAGTGPPAKPLTAHQLERETTRSILDALDQFACDGGKTDPALLRYDPGSGSAGVRGGVRGDVIDLPSARVGEGR